MASEPISVRPLDLAVAGEVRAEIGRKNLTVSGIAIQLGMRRATLTARTQGHVPFSPSLLDAVAAVLGMKASQIVERAERTLDDPAAAMKASA
jgi:transcriptional regulator with XRE-family HTH domain